MESEIRTTGIGSDSSTAPNFHQYRSFADAWGLAVGRALLDPLGPSEPGLALFAGWGKEFDGAYD
jgi:hypothetical protein